MDNGYTERMPHHTAIVFKVLENNKYVLAHQNINGIKKLTTITLNLNYLKKGKITFFRPQKY